MKDNVTYGVVFLEKDIRSIMDYAVPQLSIKDNSGFFVEIPVNEDFVPGKIYNAEFVRLTGAKNADAVTLYFKPINSSGKLISLNVPVNSQIADIDDVFDDSFLVSGVRAVAKNGVPDFYSAEEREFSDRVNTLLGNRTDEYAEMFKSLNNKNHSVRRLTLLHRMELEIRRNALLNSENYPPSELISRFISITDSYNKTLDKIDRLSRTINNIDPDIKPDEHKITMNNLKAAEHLNSFYKSVIDSVIMPAVMG